MNTIKKIVFLFCFSLLVVNSIYAQTSDSAAIKQIFNEILKNGKAYSNLDYLSNKIGGRLSGSPQAASAVEWAVKAMKEAGADTVFLQECMVPHWVRGEKEIAKIIGVKNIDVPVCALGGSIATPKEGITADVIEVKNFEELEKLGEKIIKGKIIFFNRPMEPTEIFTFNAYSGAVNQRGKGASEAVKYGAVGVVVRSMSITDDDFPHTGAMNYSDSTKKIPACAISTNAANMLSNMLRQNVAIKFYFKQNCVMLPDVKSYNVVGEIRGTSNADEIIAIGGHLDSWDTGDGAHDDGAGVVQSIEVLRTFKALNIKSKRTIRAIAFMNEENGLRGGKKYAELAEQKKEKHLIAMESDAGGFSPRGFSFDGTKQQKEKILQWKPLFLPYGVYDFSRDGGGADISALHKQGVPVMDLVPDSQRYFDVHHTANDTFKNVNKRELHLGAASITSMIYLLSLYGL